MNFGVPVRVEAEVMHREMKAGRNNAILLGCRSEAGASVDCVVKLAACLAGSAPLPYLVEWCATAFGRLIGINVPTPFEVMLTQPFAMSLDPPWRDRALKSIGSAFGSAHCAGGFAQWLPNTLIPLDLRTAAVDILAFDVLIDNPDRRYDNPNVLARREELLAIDHDMAFSFLFAVGSAVDPAEAPLLTEVVDRHVFARGLGRLVPSLESFKVRVAGITDAQSTR